MMNLQSIKSALVMARSTLRTAHGDTAEDLLMLERKRVIERRMESLSEAIREIEREQSKAVLVE